ncbi:MAG: response regulator [Candidatus Omnitrophica bacterium]|nr:response regulator [Candidatus Omnitrophota bacterium]
MPNKRILIVDNDKTFLSELGETLELSGYDMVVVDDPRKTIEMADLYDISLFLLDLKMPALTGFELAHELNHISRFSHIPIIAMSGYYKTEYESIFETCGIRKCLKKPFKPLDLITQIETILL